MKADPKRRSHTMGAKWLRQGGKNPVVFSAEQSGEEGRKLVSTKDAVNDHYPVNSGNRMDMAGSSKLAGGKVIP